MFQFLRIKWVPVLLWVILIGVVVLLWNQNSKKAEEIRRLSSNQESLVSGISYYKDKLGREVAKVRALELSKTKFENVLKDKAEQITQLKLKVRRLESFSSAVSEIRDSVVIEVQKPILLDTLVVRKISYKDDWLSLDGSLIVDGLSALGDSRIQLNYSVKDSLDFIIYREPKRFWFIRYGTKSYELYVRSRNPRSHVVAGSCVIIKK